MQITLMKFLLLFFGIGGLLLIIFRVLFFRWRNQKGKIEQKNALEFFQTTPMESQKVVECHNWNPGIKNHAYLFNLADLFLTDYGILVIPSVKSILGLEKWTPIFLFKENNSNLELPEGILKKKITRIEQKQTELKVFFDEKSIINSTVELNFKSLEKEFVDKVVEWNA